MRIDKLKRGLIPQQGRYEEETILDDTRGDTNEENSPPREQDGT